MLGLGMGIIIAKTVIWKENYYWLISSGALILGGFFIALGILTKPKKKEKELPFPEREAIPKEQETKENNDQARNS